MKPKYESLVACVWCSREYPIARVIEYENGWKYVSNGDVVTKTGDEDRQSIADELRDGDRRQAEKDEKFKTPDGGRLFEKTMAFWRDLARQHNGLTIQVLMDELSYDVDKANIALNDLKRRGWVKDGVGCLHPPGRGDRL